MNPLFSDDWVISYCGHNAEIMAELPEGCVDMVFTSPPYYLKRKYKIDDLVFENHNGCDHDWVSAGYRSQHPDRSSGSHDNHGNGKFVDNIDRGIQGSRRARGASFEFGQFCAKCGAWKGQLGLEPNVDQFIKHLGDSFDAARRLLKPTGSLWVNIGETYAGSGGGYSIIPCSQMRNHGSVFKKPLNCNIRSKSQIGIPERFKIEMVDRGWVCRNTIIRHSANCMPSSARDRFTVDFEYIYWFTLSNRPQFWVNIQTLQSTRKTPRGVNGSEGFDWRWLDCPYCASGPEKRAGCTKCKGAGRIKETLWTSYDYYFNQQFEPQSGGAHSRGKQSGSLDYQIKRGSFMGFLSPTTQINAGRNKRSVWTVNAIGSEAEHYATFPTDICTTPILSTCPESICVKCGLPRVKVYQRRGGTIGQGWVDHEADSERGMGNHMPIWSDGRRLEQNPYEVIYMGESDCRCKAGFRPGVVADIYAGTGTTGREARRLNRKSILMDLSPEYCQIQKQLWEAKAK